jgi:hypothetical protein
MNRTGELEKTMIRRHKTFAKKPEWQRCHYFRAAAPTHLRQRQALPTPLFDDDRDSTMTAASDGRLRSLPVAGKRAAGSGLRSFVRPFQPLGSKSR